MSESQIRPGVSRTLRSLKGDKLSLIRRVFRVPSSRPLTLPESHGYELYQFSGVTDLENKAFILPKLFISSTADQGSILGYYQATPDEQGRKVVTISIPTALVDGKEAAIAVPGSGITNMMAARMPGHLVIPDLPALQRAVAPRTLETLAVCPKGFRLRFHGREYYGASPFEQGTLCPINQFFRVSFTAPEEEFSELLEQAALQEGSVELTAELAADYLVPRLVNQLSVAPTSYTEVLDRRIAESTALRGAYRVQDLERAVNDALWDLMREVDADPTYPIDMSSNVARITDNYFMPPSQCADRQGMCRARRTASTQRDNVRITWMAFEPLVGGIRANASTDLSTGTNGKAFISQPSPEVLARMSRPSWWEGHSYGQLIDACGQFAAVCNEPVPVGSQSYCHPTGAEDNARVGVEFCRKFLQQAGLMSERNNGYKPLGTDTVVYPGALLRIDFDQLAELTRSRFKQDETGRQVIASDLIDHIAETHGQRTTCAQGGNTACLEYKMIDKPELDSHGEPVYGESHTCSEGASGCVCVGEGSQRRCSERGPLRMRTEREVQCSPSDQELFCPYHRIQKEKVGENVEYECKEETESASAWIFFTSNSKRLVCKESKRTVVSEDRAHPYCIGFDPQNPNLGLTPEINCKRPRYICNRWASNCSQYTLNEDYNLLHDNPDPRWRDYATEQGEWPERLRDQLYLRFVSPKGGATDCRLDRFRRYFRGKTMFVKIPRPGADDNVCGLNGGEAIWNAENVVSDVWPSVEMKNAISFPQLRKCGRTEYRFVTTSIPMLYTPGEVPPNFSLAPVSRFGPVPNTCFAQGAVTSDSGMEYVFNEYAPIRIMGRVTVLGRVLQAISGPGPTQAAEAMH